MAEVFSVVNDDRVFGPLRHRVVRHEHTKSSMLCACPRLPTLVDCKSRPDSLVRASFMFFRSACRFTAIALGFGLAATYQHAPRASPGNEGPPAKSSRLRLHSTSSPSLHCLRARCRARFAHTRPHLLVVVHVQHGDVVAHAFDPLHSVQVHHRRHRGSHPPAARRRVQYHPALRCSLSSDGTLLLHEPASCRSTQRPLSRRGRRARHPTQPSEGLVLRAAGRLRLARRCLRGLRCNKDQDIVNRSRGEARATNWSGCAT